MRPGPSASWQTEPIGHRGLEVLKPAVHGAPTPAGSHGYISIPPLRRDAKALQGGESLTLECVAQKRAIMGGDRAPGEAAMSGATDAHWKPHRSPASGQPHGWRGLQADDERLASYSPSTLRTSKSLASVLQLLSKAVLEGAEAARGATKLSVWQRLGARTLSKTDASAAREHLTLPRGLPRRVLFPPGTSRRTPPRYLARRAFRSSKSLCSSQSFNPLRDTTFGGPSLPGPQQAHTGGEATMYGGA